MSTFWTLAALGHAGVPGRHALQPEHLAILVLQFVCTFLSYGTLIQDFCDGASHTTLPDSTLRSDYPCSANRVQKALYIIFHAPEVLRDLVTIQHPDSWVSCVNLASLLRLPLALLLPYSIYERLTVAILYGARLTPMAVHLIRWRNPPPSYAAVWFLVINPATELFAYAANPVRSLTLARKAQSRGLATPLSRGLSCFLCIAVSQPLARGPLRYCWRRIVLGHVAVPVQRRAPPNGRPARHGGAPSRPGSVSYHLPVPGVAEEGQGGRCGRARRRQRRSCRGHAQQQQQQQP